MKRLRIAHYKRKMAEVLIWAIKLRFSTCKLAVFLGLSLTSLSVYAQQDSLFTHINNETVSYHISIIGAKFKNGRMEPTQYLVRVDKLANDSSLIKKMTPEKWIKALNDPDTDWAANLLLYELYKKRGLFF
ncbi:hypothetical protein CLV42_102125 [Chitinophaga ginsengisoli]|uniref:Uncharacterized protein n=2 Tax=Chitinophaga ginsengisoli TaxID=363837 RepID=A0A2P8GKR3_9BACT|nr:hypothetical protein CLV42_102125 [Chitinophaga ginsengisoli]